MLWRSLQLTCVACVYTSFSTFIAWFTFLVLLCPRDGLYMKIFLFFKYFLGYFDWILTLWSRKEGIYMYIYCIGLFCFVCLQSLRRILATFYILDIKDLHLSGWVLTSATSGHAWHHFLPYWILNWFKCLDLTYSKRYIEWIQFCFSSHFVSVGCRLCNDAVPSIYQAFLNTAKIRNQRGNYDRQEN